MSTQTLAFFENKTDEQIIDWMLTNLTEEQIKMCLNTSGIPDTSGLTIPEPVPVPVPAPPSVPVPASVPAAPSVPDVPRRDDLNTRILLRFRELCPSKVILVEKLEGTTVYFYQFKEVTDQDLQLNSQLRAVLGKYRWVFRTKSRNEMRQICVDAIDDADDDIDEDPDAYRNPPQKVNEIARSYLDFGLPYPLPFGGPETTSIAVQDNIVYDPRIQTARNIQVRSSQKINEDRYPKIFKRGIRTFPVIIYKIQNERLYYYVLSMSNGNLILQEKNIPIDGGYNTIFRKEAKNLEEVIPEDFPEDANLVKITTDLIEKLPDNTKDSIKQVYTITDTGRFTFFGTDSDSSYDMLDSEMYGREELDTGGGEIAEELVALEETFEKLDPDSQDSGVLVDPMCIECSSDKELMAYKGRVSELHCKRCIERRDMLIKGPKSIAHTHDAVKTVRKNPDGSSSETVQWKPKDGKTVQFAAPEKIDTEEDILVF